MSIYKNGKLIAGGRQCMPLLSFMWADHQLNDASWLRADTFSWQSGAVYQAAYAHLAADITGKTLQSETVGGTTVQFYLADDGHKICPASEESNVAAIYAATGVAWYYIIDTSNQRFKLPRAKPLNGAIAGNGMTLGVTKDNTTINTLIGLYGTWSSVSGTNLFVDNYNSQIGGAPSHTNAQGALGITTDPTKSGIIAERDNTDQHKYLYFYVGSFTQTALENTAGLNAELFNGKADVSTVAHVVTEFQEPTSANNYTWYRKYADGWVEQGGCSTTSPTTYPVTMGDTNYTLICVPHHNQNATTYWSDFGHTKTTTGFSFRIPGNGMDWQVSGMAAN